MLARNRRQLPELRRATTYLAPDRYAWLESAATAQGWSVSKFLAVMVDDAYVAERLMLAEEAEEAAAAVGAL